MTRIVILTRRYAIKLPRFDRGWSAGLIGLLANMQEQRFACLSGTAPIVLSLPGGWAVVAHRCEPLTDIEWAAAQNMDWDGVPVEMKRDSFGALGDRIVAVDYGS